MKAIIAINNLGYIGLNNKMLWRSSADFKHFRKLTEHSTCIVGYNTFQELPPLKNRIVIQDHRTMSFKKELLEDTWCIGGKKTYEKYAHLFTEIHISHINDNSIGDTMLPQLKLTPECKIFNYNFEVNK